MFVCLNVEDKLQLNFCCTNAYRKLNESKRLKLVRIKTSKLSPKSVVKRQKVGRKSVTICLFYGRKSVISVRKVGRKSVGETVETPDITAIIKMEAKRE